ncbi:MAG: hypothetical protein EOO46_05745 [Flavobacterium sp.]|nr:MAG: hypothetical protein EOO46_05745 [Flavobacterium sp.]
MKFNSEITVLDCTFRDGGYYNNWDYKPKLVSKYLSALKEAKVDHIELGFRTVSQKNYLGPFAYTAEDLLDSLDLKGLSIGIMINGKDIVDLNSTKVSPAKYFFPNLKKSKLKFVRFACHLHEIPAMRETLDFLKGEGITVGLNLMQSTGKTSNEIENISREVESWKNTDVFYFADSLGNMNPAQLKEIVSTIRKGWTGPLGFHGHNNQGKALENTLEAIHNGVTWLDATVLGMGRGAGNTKIEYLLAELKKAGVEKYSAKPIFELVAQEFDPLMKKYGWGENVYYYLGAEYGIHPTYIQEFLSLYNENGQKILDGLEILKKSNSNSFSRTRLQEITNANQNHKSEGDAGTVERFSNDVVLILGGGESIADHAKIIQSLKLKNPNFLTINLNAHNFIDEACIDLYASCNSSRIFTEWKELSTKQQPILLPKATLQSTLAEEVSKKTVVDYGICVTGNKFDVSKSVGTLPNEVVAQYAIAFANAIGAKTILLAGFDGYDRYSPKQREMIEFFEIYNSQSGRAKLLAITPTSYPVVQGSAYDPHLFEVLK